MDDRDEPRPMTPLDEIYAALLHDQPHNTMLWERIVERAKREGRKGREATTEESHT